MPGLSISGIFKSRSLKSHALFYYFMARIKIDIPGSFSFRTTIPIRITDINYGGHVGNDTILSLLHEGRVQFLNHFGYQELNIDGMGLIMSDVAIDFKKEAFYGDHLNIFISAGEFTKVTFELYYKLETEVGEKTVVIAVAKTSMVCYDYSNKKITSLPHGIKEKLSA
ncbi:MAG: thioesterase family protein [Chitinophagaceae bacterium]